MKKKILINCLLLLCSISYAQENKFFTAFSLQLDNHLQFTPDKSPFKNFYAFGSQANIFVKDKFFLGFSQYTSLAPSALQKSVELSSNNIKAQEYALNAGYKHTLGNHVYLTGAVRAGYFSINSKSNNNNGFKEKLKELKGENGSFFFAPDLRMGYSFNKYFAIEGGVNYRVFLEKDEISAVSPSQLNGFGAQLSFVGSIPF